MRLSRRRGGTHRCSYTLLIILFEGFIEAILLLSEAGRSHVAENSSLPKVFIKRLLVNYELAPAPQFSKETKRLNILLYY